jgi:serine/threonine-protein kinase RsbW
MGMESLIETGTESKLRLVVPSRAENVALVRQALRGAFEILGIDETRLLDINASVSEACNNVVVHAYADDEGPMEVEVCVQDKELEIVVVDQGVGIQPKGPGPELQIHGLGLSLIQTLSDRVEVLGGAGQGTKVRMAFALNGAPDGWQRTLEDGDQDVPAPPGELVIAVSAGPLAAPVLGRLIAMLTARAGFSLEGISEAQFVTDALAAYAPGAVIGEKIQLGIDLPGDRILIRVGPVEDGGATRMVEASAVGDLPPVLERLSERHHVERTEGGELLCLTLADRA